MSRALFVLLLLGVAPLRAAAPPVSETPGAVRLGSDRLRVGEDDFVVAPNGRLLASSEIGGVCLWDLPSGKVARRFEYAEYAKGRVHAFCPESRSMAVSLSSERDEGGHPSSFGLIDVKTGQRLPLLDRDRGFHVSKAAFLDRGRAVCCFEERSCAAPLEHAGLHVWALPSGKKLGRIGHATCFATSPGGDVLATGHENGWVRFYDAKSLARIGSVWAHIRPVFALALSPDGRLLASRCTNGGLLDEGPLSRPNAVAIWDVASRKRVRVIKELAGGIDLQFVTNQALYGGGGLEVYDARAGRAITPAPIEHEWLASPAFSADGSEIAFVRPDGRVEVRRVDGKGPGTILRNTPTAARDVAFADGGRSVVVRGYASSPKSPLGGTSSSSGGGCGVWDRATGADSRRGAGHRGKILRVAYSRDGKTLASLDEAGELRLTRLPGGMPHPSFTPRSAGWVMQIQLAPGGDRLCAFAMDGRATFWDMANGKRGRSVDLLGDALREALAKRSTDFWDSVCCYPLGKNLVIDPSCRLAVVRASETSLEVVRLDSGERRRLPLTSPHDYRRPSFAVSDGGRYVAASRKDGFELWDLSRDKRILEADDGGYGFAFSADGRYFAWGDGSKVRLYDLPKRREAARFEFDTFGVFPLTLAFDADGRTLAAHDESRIVYWDVATKKRRGAGWLRSADDLLFPLRSGAVLSSETYLDEGHSVRTRDLSTGMGILPPMEVPESSHDTLVAVTPDGRVIAVGGRVVTLIDRATGKVIGRLPRYHRGLISAMAFSPDGRSLVTGGTDAAVFVWDWKRFRDPAK